MNQSLPTNYEEKVYAGWLGKCIGVRFGAPIENWTYEKIRDKLGELTTYVYDDKHKIFKPDDDTAVPMILIRALEDYGATVDITPQQIADTLVNYIADQQGSFWWGGYGISTEHTAYLNLVNGIPAPRSGSVAQNGATIAEQIGGQIFSDIWGLIAPDNPTLAANFAGKASSVTHGGNGIYGGRFIAAMISAAFGDMSPNQLLAIGLEQIPDDSEYARVIQSMIDFHSENPHDWREAFLHLKANFGYDRYSGVVHIIPNAGVIALGLLYGEGDFSKTLQITNMAGWDTDCNVGNVGTIMGVLCGLDSIDAHWRDPMNDLLITANLIGTRNILTIPQCTDLFVRLGKQLAGVPIDDTPRYHFCYRGSTQKFDARGNHGQPIHLMQAEVDDTHVLRTTVHKLNKTGEVSIFTRTYYHPDELSSNYYGAGFTPLIYSGQTITAKVHLPADAPTSIRASLYVYDENHDQSYQATDEEMIPGKWHTLTYTIPPLEDACLSEVGIVIRNTGDLWSTGSFNLESLDWSGIPEFKTTFASAKPESGAIAEWTYLRGYWRMDAEAYHGSSVGEGETYTGDILWTDYNILADMTPLIGDYHNILFRVQGALRGYAFGLAPDNTIKLYKKDRVYQVIGSSAFNWEHGQTYQLTVSIVGNQFKATIEGGGQSASIVCTDDTPLLNGQIGLGTWHGSRTAYHSLAIKPAQT